ncbi:hypothetical protein EDC04DRAFT_2664822 [Pisolithus marmoratus]|nr:hypothetical protein EDC04DRAFT_2664822 [Pisolithus marmoratus]
MCPQSIVVVTEELGSVSDIRRTYGHRFPFARPAYVSEEASLFIQATMDDLDIIHELVRKCGKHCAALHSNTKLQPEQDVISVNRDFANTVPSVSHGTSKILRQVYAVPPSSVVPVGDISENEPVIGFVILNVCTEHDRTAIVQALNSLPSVLNIVLPELYLPIPDEESTSPVSTAESIYSHGSNHPHPTFRSPCTTYPSSPPTSSTLRRTPPPPLPSPSPPSTPTSAPCFLNEYNYNCYVSIDNGQFCF